MGRWPGHEGGGPRGWGAISDLRTESTESSLTPSTAEGQSKKVASVRGDWSSLNEGSVGILRWGFQPPDV